MKPKDDHTTTPPTPSDEPTSRPVQPTDSTPAPTISTIASPTELEALKAIWKEEYERSRREGQPPWEEVEAPFMEGMRGFYAKCEKEEEARLPDRHAEITRYRRLQRALSGETKDESELSYPPFPEKAMVGLAGEIAHFYAETQESPVSFFFMNTLAFLGAALGSSLLTLKEEEPRLYVVAVAPFGAARKSEALKHIRDLFGELAGCVIESVGSGEGLLKRFEKHPRVVLMPDELSRLVKKGGIDGSTLYETLTTLFTETTFSHHVSKQEASINVRDAHLTLVSATTPDLYTTMFDVAGITGGLVSRIFVVASGEKRIKPPVSPDPSKVHEYHEKLRRQIEEATSGVAGRSLTYTTEAEALWMEYYQELRKGTSPIFERLDTYGLRLPPLLGVTKVEKEVSLETVESVIALLEYQREVRLLVQPVEAENAIAGLGQLILRRLANGQWWGRSSLYKSVHADRHGTQKFDYALSNLTSIKFMETRDVSRGGREYRATVEGLKEARG